MPRQLHISQSEAGLFPSGDVRAGVGWCVFFFQMNLEMTKIFKAKLRVCHCEIRFLTLRLMYAYFSPHFLLQFYASLFTTGTRDMALPKGGE